MKKQAETKKQKPVPHDYIICSKCFEEQAVVSVTYCVEWIELECQETSHNVGALCLQCMIKAMGVEE